MVSTPSLCVVILVVIFAITVPVASIFWCGQFEENGHGTGRKICLCRPNSDTSAITVDCRETSLTKPPILNYMEDTLTTRILMRDTPFCISATGFDLLSDERIDCGISGIATRRVTNGKVLLLLFFSVNFIYNFFI